jgi:hypothetical protein
MPAEIVEGDLHFPDLERDPDDQASAESGVEPE